MTLLIHDIPIAFRPATIGDASFVISTWLKSEMLLRAMPRARYERWRRPVIERHVDRDSVLVACSAEVPRTIYGWACHDGPHVVLYAYVVFGMRGAGLGHALVRQVKETAGHG